jgi:lycopene beta-cyclase
LNNSFDYIIIGAGLAGFQLALRFCEDDFFKDKSIALIDASKKNSNDRTWCFWEQGNGKYETIVFKSWSEGQFFSKNKTITLNLNPYHYKMIKGLDFYNYAKSKIARCPNIQFINDTVETLIETNDVEVKCTNATYKAKHVFDSRIPDDYCLSDDNYTRVHQHFKGWIIKTDNPVFNPEVFTMMDYRMQYQDDTTFMYVLPFTEDTALVEFTFFTPYLVDNNLYDDFLKRYISDLLNVKQYHILEEELGVIPMTDFPFEKYHTPKVTKIGTAGGWVKGSSGYAFKSSEEKSKIIVGNIKQNLPPHKNILKRRNQFYDKIFLKVLGEENKKGAWVFETFYSKTPTPKMFKFLDEKTEFLEELKIMSSLMSWSFIKAFFKSL